MTTMTRRLMPSMNPTGLSHQVLNNSEEHCLAITFDVLFESRHGVNNVWQGICIMLQCVLHSLPDEQLKHLLTVWLVHALVNKVASAKSCFADCGLAVREWQSCKSPFCPISSVTNLLGQKLFCACFVSAPQSSLVAQLRSWYRDLHFR